MHGGSRQGAGRKKGYSAVSAEEARKYVSRRVSEELEPLVDVLIEKSKNGDLKAMNLLLNRAWGRPSQEVKMIHREDEQEVTQRIKNLSHIMNYGPLSLEIEKELRRMEEGQDGETTD